MNKKIKVVIGANFGDEGKGLMTDYFCNKFDESKDVLNVRFNGGSQAGHTVVTPDGLRHVFNHFGAGSFNKNVVTYLSPDFILNPIIFRKEYEKLITLGINPRIIIHPMCMVTTPYDMILNQIIEKSRDKRHGSCGLGVYETIIRYNDSSNSLHFCEMMLNMHILADYLKDISDKYVSKRLKDLNISKIEIEDMDLLNKETILINYIEDLIFMYNNCIIETTEDLSNYENIVFEGAQGLLLDKDNKDYFPNLTPSNTGLKNIIEILNKINKKSDKIELEICYITRSYLTRHGAGKFLTECKKDLINPNMIDLTNHKNDYQGNFRYGFLDIGLFIKTTSKDFLYLDGLNFKDTYDTNKAFVITHLDETNEELIGQLGKISIEESNLSPKYTSLGMTRNTVAIKL